MRPPDPRAGERASLRAACREYERALSHLVTVCGREAVGEERVAVSPIRLKQAEQRFANARLAIDVAALASGRE